MTCEAVVGAAVTAAPLLDAGSCSSCKCSSSMKSDFSLFCRARTQHGWAHNASVNHRGCRRRRGRSGKDWREARLRLQRLLLILLVMILLLLRLERRREALPPLR